MNNRKKKTLLIGILCAVLVIMGVGYAILSQSLNIGGLSNINGSWNVYIESITPTTKGTGRSVSTSIEDKKLSASFEVELLKPGDYVEYTVVVKNSGTIDAKLVSVTPTIIDSHEYVTFTNSLNAINNSVILKKNEELSFTIKVEFTNIDTITNGQSISPEYKVALNFRQLNNDSTDNEVLQTNQVQEVTTLASGDVSVIVQNQVVWKYLSTGELKVTGLYEMNGMGNTFYTTSSYHRLTVNQQIIAGILLNDGYTETQIFGTVSNRSLSTGSLVANMLVYMIWDEDLFKSYSLENFGVEFINWDSFTTSLVTKGTITETQKTFIMSYVGKIPKITKITIGEGISAVGGFKDLGYVGEIVLPSTMVEIGTNAFENNGITSVTFNEGLKKVGIAAFKNNKITTIILPSTLNLVSEHSFESNQLTSVLYKSGAGHANSSFKCNPLLTYENIKYENTSYTTSPTDYVTSCD